MTNTARRAAVDKVGFARSLRPYRPQSTRKADLTKLHHVLGREPVLAVLQTGKGE